MAELNTVGKKIRKVDGLELVTGKAKFTGDLRFPGMLYGYEVRAGIPAGEILSIRTGAALELPGVKAVLTAADIPGPNLIGILPPFDQPVLPDKEIRYAGESVALVIADSRDLARRASLKVEVDIRPFDPILEPDDALDPEARKIHPDGNITYSKKLIKGDAERELSEADTVVTGVYETSFQDHGYLEPEAVCAVPAGDGRDTLYASCQSPFHIRGHVAANLGVPASMVKVVQAYTGGSFGGKDDVAVEIGILAAVAAGKLGFPVMITHDRGESIIGSNVRHAAKIEFTTGAMKDGTITARKVKVLLDGGAYASESPFVTMKALIHAAGPYNVDNILVESTSVYTNKTYAGACRGFGVPQVTFASESQIDVLAKALKMDPIELRRKNGLKAGDKTASSQVFEQSVGYLETVDAIEAVRKDLPEVSEDGRYLYGTGVASVIQGISNGAEGVDVVGASVQMSQDGSVLVGCGLADMGQGSRTVFAQVVAEVLGVPVDSITVRQVDTDSVHDSGPTVASRATSVGGLAVKKAAEEVRKSLVTMASMMFETKEEMIVLKEGFAVLTVDDNARIPLPDVATAAYWTGFPLMNLTFSKAPAATFDHDTHQGDIYIAYNFGTHLMRV
ncbi:MAG: xanthine dehydrogenase family protein, partial [Spirochaetales bacterium]|nr:xanthine dehydrogenase family protein [Spirochaetales bacterium]